jgi:UDP-GlcNAc:undecaprenyl-phosphate GlcNAc-1-phosphate transferase
MSEALRLTLALVISFSVTLIVTPGARWLAVRTGFLDHPAGYKIHRAATPYLGGLAVVAGFTTAAAVTGEAFGKYALLTACLWVMLVVGTVDDRLGLGVLARLAVQIAVAVVLWAGDLGWALVAADPINLAITVLWVVGITNAFNLMDNQDGAAATVAACCGVGVAVLAGVHGQIVVAALGLALAGACGGFLPYNLSRPSRIFLGDGGSMPIGVAVATLIMIGPAGGAEWSDLLAAAPLAGLPILDTSLVVYSRWRRHVPILSGARDHVTHRLLIALHTPARVAAVLAAVQLALCALAVGLFEAEPAEIALIALSYLALGVVVIALLDDSRWLPGAAAERAQVVEELPG